MILETVHNVANNESESYGNLASLKEAAETVTDNPAAETDGIMSRVVDSEAEESASMNKHIVELHGVRHKGIPIDKRTQLVIKEHKKKDEKRSRGLHMTKLKDYNGGTVLLCRGPVIGQRTDQWRAIWQGKVSSFIFAALT